MALPQNEREPQNDVAERAREIGRRQSLFREVNERIEELTDSFDMQDGLSILCECGNDRCSEQIALTPAAYEEVRRIPTRFAILPGHELPDVERIVERFDGFLVVEKVGDSAVTAINLDPRRQPR